MENKHLKEGITKRTARVALTLSACAIGVAYASAFKTGGAPVWAAWLLAFGIPTALVSIMIMGAARQGRGVKRLLVPFAFVGILLTAGFVLALSLPGNEGPQSALIFGLPLRAAIIIYGVGLIPIVILPIGYALTFETRTLSVEDLERVRAMGREFTKNKS
jgi:hypothetical protein